MDKMDFLNLLEIKKPLIRNALRAATATAIAILVDRLFHLAYGYWILIATIIVMQANLGASIIRARQRIIGTILGVLVGMMFATVFHHHLYFLFIAVPVLILLTIYTIPFSYTISIFLGSILLIIMLTHNKPGDPWLFVFHRIIDTLIGAGIGLTVCMFFWPTWAKEDFRYSLGNGIKECHQFFLEIIQAILDKNPIKIDVLQETIETEKSLLKTRQRFDDFTHEPGSMIIVDGTSNAILYSQERIHSIILSLYIIAKQENIHLSPALKEALEACLKNTTQIVDTLINAIEEQKPLPDFTEINQAWQKLKSEYIQCNTHETIILLYRNLFSYISELKHITESFYQLRGRAEKFKD